MEYVYRLSEAEKSIKSKSLASD